MPKKKTIIKTNAPAQGALKFDLSEVPEVTTRNMARFVERLNRVNPKKGETKMEFSAADIGDVLYGNRDTGSRAVYRLYDEGYIGGADLGTGRKRQLHVSRYDFMKFLEERCADKTKTWER